MKTFIIAATCALAAILTSATPAGATTPVTTGEWVCVPVAGHETTLRLPSRIVDRLVTEAKAYRGPCAEYGASAALGDGTLTAYSQRVGDRPVAVGLIMTESSFNGLPYDPPNDGKWCFDKDGDGTTDPMMECSGGYGSELGLNESFRRHVDTPFAYVLANWNPQGHMPTEIYGVPHYDIHFYLQDPSERLEIRTGPCGELVDCDDYVLGKRLPGPGYVPPDFVDLDAVAPAMGNHLVDQTSPEFHGEPFTRTWIYGTWDGQVTFYEAMVAQTVYTGDSAADGCFDIKQPTAWQQPGWYPTTYCIRHRPHRGEVVTSLEGFVHRA